MIMLETERRKYETLYFPHSSFVAKHERGKKKLKEKKTRGKYGAGKLTITCQRRKNPEIE